MTDIIKDIKEKVEKGEEAVKEIVKKVTNETKKKTDKKLAKSQIDSDDEKLVNKKDSKSSDESNSKEDLVKKAEAESTDPKTEKSLEEKKKELLAKAKKLASKVDITETEKLKEKVKIKKRTDMLIPLEEYVKSGIYLGTRVVTPKMKPFVYRRRADGLAIFNTDIIDEKLKEAVEFLAKFDPKDVIVSCKRQAGWKAAQMFGEVTGIRIFTRKYPAGILTNTTLPDFFENELTIITDAWLDKNALNDTINIHKQILMICDTNNFPKGTKNIIIGNNKSPRSLGVIFYLLARGYCKARGIEVEIPDLEHWQGENERRIR